MTENKKIELKDNLNKEHIEQLHRVILNFSTQSFEMKRMCVTVEIAAFTLISTIFKDNYSDGRFFTLIKIFSLSIPLLFYIIDILTYYYQDKLRMKMLKEENEIRKRHDLDQEDEKRFTQKKMVWARRIMRSVFNGSNLIYWGLIVLSIIAPTFF